MDGAWSHLGQPQGPCLMAIIKIGAPLSGIRGTVGGITYSANGSGPFAKQWATPTNPRSARQSVERSYLASMSYLWSVLTTAQKTAWDTFAALPAQELTNSLGEAYYASGFNWFAKCNVRLMRLARSTIIATPTQARPAAPTLDDFRVCNAGSESDLCTGGAASASTSDPAYPVVKAFDGLLGVNDMWRSLTPNTTGWVQYTFASAKKIQRFRYYTTSWDSSRLPRNFTFEVYTSGAWTPLLTVTNAPQTLSAWLDFRFPNPYTETPYRINVSANWGGSNYLTIMEIEMYADTLGGSCICYPEDDFADSPDYDLVLHVSIGSGPGQQVQYSRYLETLVTQSPDRWSEEFQSQLTALFGTIPSSRSWFARLYRQTQEGIRSAAATARTETQ